MPPSSASAVQLRPNHDGATHLSKSGPAAVAGCMQPYGAGRGPILEQGRVAARGSVWRLFAVSAAHLYAGATVPLSGYAIRRMTFDAYMIYVGYMAAAFSQPPELHSTLNIGEEPFRYTSFLNYTGILRASAPHQHSAGRSRAENR